MSRFHQHIRNALIRGGSSAPAPEFPTEAFVMRVAVTAEDLTFQWPNRSGTRNALIKWGDGTEEINVGTATSNYLGVHTYPAAGEYDIQVIGTYTAPSFNNGGDRLKVVDIRQWGAIGLAPDHREAFDGCANMVVSATDAFGMNSIHIRNSFRDCQLADPDCSKWDLRVATNALTMWQGSGQTQAGADKLLKALYDNRMARTAAPITMPLRAGIQPSGIYQNPSPNPPTTGKEYEFILENDPNNEGFIKWTITY
jgi:hypothetical protein